MMKYIRYAVLVILPSVFLFCKKDDNIKVDSIDCYKILVIGNSFSEDATDILPDLISAANIHDVFIGRAELPGCSLEQHWNYYQNNTSAYEYTKLINNKWEKERKKISIHKVLTDEFWDVVIIQQSSPLSGIYDTYQPYLNNLLSAMSADSKNNNLLFGWHMTWAYAPICKLSSFKVYYNSSQIQMYDSIKESLKRVLPNTDISLLIPSGEVIQQLRNSELNNPPYDLTRDGYHIDLETGRYALACTWFESLIAPRFNKTIIGNKYRTAYNGNIVIRDKNTEMIQNLVHNVVLSYSAYSGDAIPLSAEY